MSGTPQSSAAGSLLGQTGDIRDFVEYIPSGKTIPEATWRSRHRNVLLLLVAHVPFLLALGLYSGTESLVTGATIPELDTLHVLGEVSVVVALAGLAAAGQNGAGDARPGHDVGVPRTLFGRVYRGALSLFRRHGGCCGV